MMNTPCIQLFDGWPADMISRFHLLEPNDLKGFQLWVAFLDISQKERRFMDDETCCNAMSLKGTK